MNNSWIIGSGSMPEWRCQSNDTADPRKLHYHPSLNFFKADINIMVLAPNNKSRTWILPGYFKLDNA